jgi:hypothetical protein
MPLPFALSNVSAPRGLPLADPKVKLFADAAPPKAMVEGMATAELSKMTSSDDDGTPPVPLPPVQLPPLIQVAGDVVEPVQVAVPAWAEMEPSAKTIAETKSERIKNRPKNEGLEAAGLDFI